MQKFTFRHDFLCSILIPMIIFLSLVSIRHLMNKLFWQRSLISNWILVAFSQNGFISVFIDIPYSHSSARCISNSFLSIKLEIDCTLLHKVYDALESTFVCEKYLMLDPENVQLLDSDISHIRPFLPTKDLKLPELSSLQPFKVPSNSA